MKASRIAFSVVLLSTLAFGQTRPEFEVASIKPSPPQFDGANVGLHIDGAQVRFGYLSLKDYVGMAYRLKPHQVTGPEWMSSERFEIAAKLPDGSLPAQVPEMLQSLLADRFKLKLHHDSKEFPVYALVVAKGGLQMTPSAPDAEGAGARGAVSVAASGNARGVGVNLGGGSYFSIADNRLEAKKLTTASFADTLSRFLDRPVVDMTDVKGNYDFVLNLSPEDYQVMLIRSGVNAGAILPPQALRFLDMPSGDSLHNGLEKLGLKLEQRKSPLDVVVVDSMLKVPTPN